MKALRERVGSSLTFSATTSLQACHEPMLNAHVLTDLELIAGVNGSHEQHVQDTVKTLDRRLAVLGSYVNDKQYLLGIRRAAMETMRYAHFFHHHSVTMLTLATMQTTLHGRRHFCSLVDEC